MAVTASSGQAEELCFAVVKFFGPARNPKGNLWGYVRVAEGPHAGQEVHVTQPHFGDSPVSEGAVRLVHLVARRGVQVASAREWKPDEEGVATLLASLSDLRSSDTGREVLRQLVPKIPAGSCPPLLFAFQPDAALAARAMGPDGFIPTLQLSLTSGGSLEWLRRMREVPPLSGAQLVSLAGMIGEQWTPALAARLVGAVTNLTEIEVVGLCRASPSWRDALLRNLPAIDVLSSPTLLDQLVDRDCFNLVMRSAMDEENSRRVVELLTVSRLSELVREFGHELSSYQVAQLHPTFVAAVPVLFDGVSEGAVLTMCAKALSAGGSQSGLASFEAVAVSRLAAWNAGGPSTDVGTGAQRQAMALLRFPPALADRMAADGALLPELQHLLACDGSLACLSDERLHIRGGHAIGALMVAEVGGRDHVPAVRRSIASAFLGVDEELTAETAGRVMLQVAEDVRLSFEQRELEGQIGALLRLLPRCPMGEAPFCEAKPPGGRDAEGNSYTDPFCPRTKHGCAAGHVAPAMNRPAERWGLMEMLGFSGAARLPLGGNTLMNGIAGWVNRLFELRERMFCAGCGAGMTFDPKYSKKYDARYHSTVMECPNHCGAPNVYFNHCYSCHALIDSRESPFVEPPSGDENQPAQRFGDGLYLCIHCANDLKPWCPKCGEPCERHRGITWASCAHCGHRVNGSRKARLPRVAAPVQDAPWDAVHLHLDEHPGWSDRREVAALRRLAGETRSHVWEEPF